MGSQISSQGTDIPLKPEENNFIINSFQHLTQGKDHLTVEALTEAWSPLVDPILLNYIKHACFRAEKPPIKLLPFQKHYSIVIHGNITEKSIFIATKIFNDDEREPQGVITSEILSFVQSTVNTYLLIMTQTKPREYMSWKTPEVHIEISDVATYSNYVIKELIKQTRVSMLQIERWLCHHPLFIQMWKEIVIYLYGQGNPVVLPRIVGGIQALPYCNIPENMHEVDSVLSISKVMFINETLPMNYRNEWTPLFNSKIHGQSFVSLVDKISHKGPTIIITADEGGHVFGGFAPLSWRVNPKFYGDSTATLFTLEPKMDRFISSGHNTNFQYLNANQLTMPNGLGMGGQMNYWGLWVDAKFETGICSVSCSTFAGYKQMSSEQDFRIKQLEVWRVGKVSPDEEDENNVPRGTILQSYGVDQFLLELSGHSFHSIGLPSAPEEEYEKH